MLVNLVNNSLRQMRLVRNARQNYVLSEFHEDNEVLRVHEEF